MNNFEKIKYDVQVIAKDTPDLFKRAKKLGLVEGHPAVSLYESILCEAELPNHNKIRLDKDALYENIDTAKFMQVNINHVGKGAIVGFIFDAFMNKKDQAVISCIFFKKIYSSEYEHSKKLFAKGELTMSYELTHDVDTTEKLKDGTRRIHDFYFTGAGLLLGEQPACDNAIVYEFAKKMENQRQELIFASKRNLKNITQPKQKEITSILASLIHQLNQNEENKMDLVAKYNCECLKCGKIISSDQHCKDIKCPECDGEMRRQERPGSGQIASLKDLFASIKKEKDVTFEVAMNFYYATEEEQNQIDEEAKKWTRKFINSLPNSAFAVIEPAYPNDTDNKNTRHLPHHDGSGDLGKAKSNTNLDLPHYRNALARMNQIKPVTNSISAEDLRKKAGNHLNRHKDALETNEEGGKSIVKIEEIKAKLSEELGELVKDWTDEDFQNEEKIAEARKAKEESAKAETEEKAEEAKSEVETEAKTSEENAEKTVVETEEKVNRTTTYDDEKKTETTEVEYEIEVRRDGKVIRTEKSKNETVYLYAQVEEIKAEYEKQINELKATLEVKDSEIAEVRANAEKIAKLKIEYANNEFVKEFKDEDWLSEDKIEEAKTLQATKEKIEANKLALKDNEFAKDFTDEDYANDDKVENASLKIEKKASEEKIKELEAKTKEETPKEDVTAEKKEDLETNHSEDVVAEKKEKNSLVEILKEKIKK